MLELDLMQMQSVSGGTVAVGGSRSHKETRTYMDQDGNTTTEEIDVSDSDDGGFDPGPTPTPEVDPQDLSDIGPDGKLTPAAKKTAEAMSKGAQAQAKAEKEAEKAENLRIPTDTEIAINKLTDAVNAQTPILKSIDKNLEPPKPKNNIETLHEGAIGMGKEILKELVKLPLKKI